MTRMPSRLRMLLGSTTIGLASLSLREGFPAPPNYGTKRRGLVLWADYFALEPSLKLILNQYHPSVNPAATGKKLAQIIQLFLQSHKSREFRHDIVTDFKSTLIARLRIQDQATTVEYRAEGEDEPRHDPPLYTIKLLFTDTLPVANLINYLTSTEIHPGRYGRRVKMLSMLLAWCCVV